jgi:predicted O-methyltransferase YrrM
MVSELRPGVQFVTVEIDEARARTVEALFSQVPGVRVIAGDWRLILEHGPFALLFADAKAAKVYQPEALIGALQPGGVVVLDDITPEDQWPEEWRGKPDVVRESWLNHPALVATEVLLTAGSAVIVGALKRET